MDTARAADRRSADDIPVIADDETAHYILKLGVGETLTIRDQSGRPRRLRLVATLAGSIFQSELLMSEANFRRLFPFQSGFGVVLVEVDAAHSEEIPRRLGQELDAFAVAIESTAEPIPATLPRPTRGCARSTRPGRQLVDLVRALGVNDHFAFGMLGAE